MTRIHQHYLVVGLSGVILSDIVGVMRKAYPQLAPLTAKSLADAKTIISDRAGVAFAFMNLAPDQFVADELSLMLDRLEARVILMGNDAEEAEKDPRFSVLDRPFTEDDVRQLLEPYG